MLGWMQECGGSVVTSLYGFSGALTIPRELRVIDNRLIISPLYELTKYRSNPISRSNIVVSNDTHISNISGNSYELHINFDMVSADIAGIKLLDDGTNHIKVYYDKTKRAIIIDRSLLVQNSNKDTVRTTNYIPIDNKLSLHIFVDKYSIEVFVDGGAHVMTANVFPPKGYGITPYTIGGTATITKLTKWDYPSTIKY